MGCRIIFVRQSEQSIAMKIVDDCLSNVIRKLFFLVLY